MNKNYSGLTSVGSEIISSNVSSQRNLLFSAGKKPKMIIKSYKITEIKEENKDNKEISIKSNDIKNENEEKKEQIEKKNKT